MTDLATGLLLLGIQATLLALVVAGLYLALRRRPALAGWVALVFPFVLLALPALALVPRLEWPISHSPALLSPEEGREVGEAEAPALPRRLARLALAPALPHTPARWPPILAGAWLAGVGLYLLRLAGGLWAVRRLVSRARPLDESSLVALAGEIGATLGLRRSVRLAET